MKEIKAIIRKDRVQDVVAALRQAGVPWLTLTHVHSLGSGVDPDDYRLSFEEGSAYTEKAKLEFVCREPEVDSLIRILCEQCRTGHRGDGVVLVSDVGRAVKIRTGEEDVLAIL